MKSIIHNFSEEEEEYIYSAEMPEADYRTFSTKMKRVLKKKRIIHLFPAHNGSAT